MKYRIKNWEQHQHFKDRTPPWIKLHRELLNDPDWFSLSGDDAKALIMLWLIASEDKTMQGMLPDVRTIAFRLRKTEKETNQQLTRLQSFLYQDDISVISERYQVDAPETETETETETPAKAVGFVFRKALLDLGADPSLVADWMAVRKTKKASNTKTAFDAFMREVNKAGYTIDQALRMCCEKNWKGFDSEWVKGIKPAETQPAIPFDRAAYEAKRKADAEAAKERMRLEQAEFMRAQA